MMAIIDSIVKMLSFMDPAGSESGVTNTVAVIPHLMRDPR